MAGRWVGWNTAIPWCPFRAHQVKITAPAFHKIDSERFVSLRVDVPCWGCCVGGLHVGVGRLTTNRQPHHTDYANPLSPSFLSPHVCESGVLSVD